MYLITWITTVCVKWYPCVYYLLINFFMYTCSLFWVCVWVFDCTIIRAKLVSVHRTQETSVSVQRTVMDAGRKLLLLHVSPTRPSVTTMMTLEDPVRWPPTPSLGHRPLSRSVSPRLSLPPRPDDQHRPPPPAPLRGRPGPVPGGRTPWRRWTQTSWRICLARRRNCATSFQPGLILVLPATLTRTVKAPRKCQTRTEPRLNVAWRRQRFQPAATTRNDQWKMNWKRRKEN